MRNMFKLAAMAFAAIALFASCEGKEEATVKNSIEGKQWIAPWEIMGVDCVMDFGATTPGTCYLAYDANELGLPGFATYITGAYTVKETDVKSGVVTITVEGQQANIQYSNLEEGSVTIKFDAAMIDTEFTLVATNKKLFDGNTGEPIQ